MTIIYIARHGETDWNRTGRLQGATDIPLNDAGKEQAADCGLFFQDVSIEAIYTSPLKRASDTATIINEHLGLPIIELSEFKERAFGDAEGMTYEERSKVFPRKSYPNQEDFKVFSERLKRGLNKIHQAYPEQSVALVAHGAVIHTLFQMVENNRFFPQHAKLSNGGVSTIRYKDGHWWLDNFNQVNHLK